MEPRFDVATSEGHFAQILALQAANQHDVLAADERGRSGFVYARHNAGLLRSMAERMPQVIALDGERVVGYTLAMSPDMRDALPELVPMFAQFDRTRWRGRLLPELRYVVGGQVCVDAAWRGRGLMAQLYRECARRVRDGHEVIATEISRRNAVSLRAHLALGFERIGAYTDDFDDWDIVAWDISALDSDEPAR